ncbi:MAG: 6,7-dimethyl-8-ribityllumazine synthase [Bdellovibrio sp.]|nr:6,7-dimethyl-8-ribityllumazine synthase [Bdellovibrio sp.]
MLRFAVVVSRFNQEVTEGLLQGAKNFLLSKELPLLESDIFRAPGAFEIPLLAQTLAKTKRYAGVICLGCVIKGDTAHFEFISLGATLGILQSSLATEVPITFGVLTTYTEEQALLRSKNNTENKGWEAAAACFEAVETLRQIQNEKRG